MDIETINLDNLDSGPTESLKIDNNLKSTMGIELLMNDKIKKSPNESGELNSPKSDINLGDLNVLEAELNDLSDSAPKTTSLREARSSIFSVDKDTDDEKINVQLIIQN